MANTFYRNHWNPIRHGYYPQAQIQPQSTKPKVINIPVRFVGSDDTTSKQSPAPAPAEEARIAAGVKIQRAVRGFLVRKNARVVRQVAAEVEQIERKVRDEEGRIRLDARERLVVSETLMALLLRLDSVRGVRDFRKRVIRRVISLQEAIDSIDQMVQNSEGSEESTIDHERTTDQTLDPDEEMKEGEANAKVEGAISTSGATEDREVSRIEVAEEASVDHETAADQPLDHETAADGTMPSHSVAEDREGSVEVAEESSIDHGKEADETLDLEEELNDAEEAELEMPILAAVESTKRKSDMIGIEIGEYGSRSPESEEEGASKSMAEVATKREEGRRMREMVEKMVEENERLKRMLAQLCATSSEQCRLMEGLVDRVEHLERVVTHRMDRRKKRRSCVPCSALSSAK